MTHESSSDKSARHNLDGTTIATGQNGNEETNAPQGPSWSQTFIELQNSVLGENSYSDQNAANQSKTIRLLSKVVEGQVIPRLVLAHKLQPDEPISVEPLIAPATIEPFASLLVSGSMEDVDYYVANLQRDGVSIKSIYLQLFAPAARLLGVQWEEDKCSFVDVTIGLGRLQGLFHRLATQHTPTIQQVKPEKTPPNALFVTPLEAQHSFGVRVAEDLFRQAGWNTACELNIDLQTLQHRLSQERFDLVGISVAVQEHVDQVRDLIEEIRRATSHPTTRIVLSGPLIALNPDLVDELGADFIARDGTEAIVLAAELGYGI